MTFFARKVNSEEYETLLKRISELQGRIVNLELEQEAFRNKVLRKIQKEPRTESGSLPWMTPPPRIEHV
jgi:hypothetical protein